MNEEQEVLGDSIEINCSNCEAPLLEVWTAPTPEEEDSRGAKIRADCPHCGDRSFVKEVKGKFFLGATKFTGIEDTETEDSGTNFQNINVRTSKVKNYGR